MEQSPNEEQEILISLSKDNLIALVSIFLTVNNFWICGLIELFFSDHDADSSAAAAPARTLPTSSISRRRATWLRFDEKQNILETLNPST
jgi:hypothetical protein